MSPSGADGEGKKDVEEAEGAAEFKLELERERYAAESSTAGESSSALKRATFLLFLEE